jgi:hypothetical protein
MEPMEPVERTVREERVVEEVAPVEPALTRRVVTERRVTGGSRGMLFNPLALVLAAVLVVFILLLVLGAM